ncbi:hypothetical protein [Paenibacillus sp. TH7-28]
MKKKRMILLLILIFVGGLYSITFIPKKLVTIQPSKVSKIEIFDGNRGELVTVTDDEPKEYIISNLNKITFRKGNLSIGYMGYKFRMTIYDDHGKVYKEIIINNSEKIRYRSFFYTGESEKIDDEYIDRLFETNR